MPGGPIHFATGTYTYDASGNVWKIGTDRYRYDLANRLLKGTVRQYGAGSYEEVEYDFADNVVNQRREGGQRISGAWSCEEGKCYRF